MSKPKGRVSRAVVHACTKNTQSHSALQKELDLLDKEKARHMKKINKDVNMLRRGVPDGSPIPSTPPPSPVGGRVGGHSPRKGSASPRMESMTLRSGSSSPAQKDSDLLPPSSNLARRRSVDVVNVSSPGSGRKSSLPAAGEGTKSKVQQCSNIVKQKQGQRSKNYTPQLSGEHVNVPQIVISEDTDQPTDSHQSFNLKKKGSSQRTPSPTPPLSSSDSGSEHESSPPTSLLVPQTKRARSNSVPSLVLPSAYKTPSPRPSHTPPDRDSPDLLRVKNSTRNRSSSFSGSLPASRRGSIPERWGSISERSRPTNHSRRCSFEVDKLMRDLRYGVLNKEMLRAMKAGHSPVDQQWEDLKDCRYLRIPSRNNSEEDFNDSD